MYGKMQIVDSYLGTVSKQFEPTDPIAHREAEIKCSC